MKAVVLAGGKGTRLYPYTATFPKSLVPVGDKPIMEYLLYSLKNHGITEIIIATGHLSELIESYFGNGEKFGLNIEYSKEETPLGTAGPLSKLKNKINDTFLLVNGDILCDINFKTLINTHKKNNCITTVVLTRRSMNIDYGVVEIDGNKNLRNWIEKPMAEYLVSTGIYAFEKEILEYIKEDEKLDLPDLIIRVIGNDQKVASYLFHGKWLDIGRPEDYECAQKTYKNFLGMQRD